MFFENDIINLFMLTTSLQHNALNNICSRFFENYTSIHLNKLIKINLTLKRLKTQAKQEPNVRYLLS